MNYIRTNIITKERGKMRTMMMLMTIIGLMTATMPKTDENTKVTLKEFGKSVSEVPMKIGNHLSMEIEKTKKFQKENWAKGKIQLAKTIDQIKGLFNIKQ